MRNPAYPEPRAPHYEKPTSVEDCLPKARTMVKKEGGRTALGPIEDGDRLLVLTLLDQNEYVAEAIEKAALEAGADEVRFLYPEDLLDDKAPVNSVTDGWKEAKMFEDGIASGSPETADLASGLNIASPLREFLGDNPEYTKVYWDIGARSQKEAVLKEHGEKFRNNWQFNNWEEFRSDAWAIPDELLTIIERKVIEVLDDAERVRVTGPQGTDIEYTLSADEAARWQETAWQSGHLYMDPLQATCVGECRGAAKVPEDTPPVFTDTTGVIAGTSNHAGFYPHMELRFEGGKLVDVDGGGEYGDRIERMMNKHADVHWPGYPEDGFFWHCDTALCTLPKAFRRTSDMFESYWRFPNLPETTRAGIIHFGFGSRRHYVDEHMEYAEENDLPLGHIHVHNYFNTMNIKHRSTGDWQCVLKRGRLSSLDDPEVRAVATKYGNPDELLSYDWIPPLPGVNCDGDFDEDYAPNPSRYLEERVSNEESV